jgi:hypothetical protein
MFPITFTLENWGVPWGYSAFLYENVGFVRFTSARHQLLREFSAKNINFMTGNNLYFLCFSIGDKNPLKLGWKI